MNIAHNGCGHCGEIRSSGTVHTTQEEFVNGGFSLKTHQMYSVHTTQTEFENPAITGHFARMIIVTPSFSRCVLYLNKL